MDSWIYIVIGQVVSFVGAGLISAVETALVGLPTARVHAAIEQKVGGARHLLFWLRHSGRILATLHVARASLTLAAGFATLALDEDQHWGVPWPLLVAVVAVTSLLISHLLPRLVAKRFPLEVATKSMWLVFGLAALLTPLIWPATWLARVFGRWLGVAAEDANPFWTPDEINRLTADAHAASLGERGEDLFLSIIEFSDTVIREIMVPRTEMITVSSSSTRAELQQVVLEAGHSRVPVYDETIDNIVGILHVKDLFLAQIRSEVASTPPTFNLRGMLRPTFYVPEIMKISELLREFQRRKTHMAIVVDEYGGTAGVVTLEDIIEEIVGEIQDEYDVEEKQFRVLGEKIIADGRVSIWDLEEALSVEFPNDAEYETLAGFLMSRTGSLPETGMVITWNNLRFTVKEANEKRIGMVEIDRPKAALTSS